MINIASTTDSDFADNLLTFYVSILEHNLDEPFHFYIIDDKLSKADRKYLSQLKDIYGNCKEITFLEGDFNYYKQANTDSPDSAIKENTYYRLELPELVDCDRILYLDSDMICKGSIVDLWNEALDGNVIGAVEDQGYVDRLEEMNVPHTKNVYFNGGLLLFDTKKWRQENITAKVRQYIADHPDNLIYQDQDALNAVLVGKWKILHPKYNVQSKLARHDFVNPDPEAEKLAVEARRDPLLIHFSGWSKPWVHVGKWVHPWRDEFYRYKLISTQRLREHAETLQNENK
ncbi:glycosyltransferase family 8 protein [Ligilactobacillus acidipiscis]|uniref:General stress protein A n=1 Tax=Ligilactobacillus acidipiscis TaxID=89059 RepID=A0A0R2K528_9LACO|nr:glycosyltransferase family 8 protein [Ligilactobacillus acidipiscis]KRN81229.1 lipopolysaccharide biosynthesis glycosyltransferase [Ligilactobacillus acidipiscis]SFV40061.1 general stress protein A [Ligilactobacillus acidipiscis]